MQKEELHWILVRDVTEYTENFPLDDSKTKRTIVKKKNYCQNKGTKGHVFREVCPGQFH